MSNLGPNKYALRPRGLRVHVQMNTACEHGSVAGSGVFHNVGIAPGVSKRKLRGFELMRAKARPGMIWAYACESTHWKPRLAYACESG